MRDLRWKKQAINDLINIARFIAQDSRTNAKKMVDYIDRKVAALVEHPHLGRAGRKSGTHELVIHENYIVVYRVLANSIEILRVKHAAHR